MEVSNEKLIDDLIMEAAKTQCEPCINKLKAELLRRLEHGQGAQPDGWIKVEDGLPKANHDSEQGEFVQVTWKREWWGRKLSNDPEDTSIASPCGIDTCFIPYFLARHFHQATHWRPLPAPPEQPQGERHCSELLDTRVIDELHDAIQEAKAGDSAGLADRGELQQMFNFGGLLDAFDMLPNDIATDTAMENLTTQINSLRNWVEDPSRLTARAGVRRGWMGTRGQFDAGDENHYREQIRHADLEIEALNKEIDSMVAAADSPAQGQTESLHSKALTFLKHCFDECLAGKAITFLPEHAKMIKECLDFGGAAQGQPLNWVNILKSVISGTYACHYQQNTFPGESEPCGECAHCRADKILGEGWETGSAQPQMSAREWLHKYAKECGGLPLLAFEGQLVRVLEAFAAQNRR